jgi:hypothetical protein
MTDAAPIRTDGRLRLVAVAVAIVVPALAWAMTDAIGYRGQAAAGAICFIAICAACSTNLRAVSWRTVLWGIALQLTLAVFILKLQIGDFRPGYELFSAVANVVRRFLEFTNEGSVLVFGACGLCGRLKIGELYRNSGMESSNREGSLQILLT